MIPVLNNKLADLRKVFANFGNFILGVVSISVSPNNTELNFLNASVF
jgi:hypothetical protein